MEHGRSQQILRISAALLLAIGLFGVVLGIAFFFDTGGGTDPLVGTAFIAISLAFLLTGAFIHRHYRQRKQQAARDTIEERILWAARHHRDRLTVPQAAISIGLPAEEVREYLEGLASRGEVDVEIGDGGTRIYCFNKS